MWLEERCGAAWQIRLATKAWVGLDRPDPALYCPQNSGSDGDDSHPGMDPRAVLSCCSMGFWISDESSVDTRKQYPRLQPHP